MPLTELLRMISGEVATTQERAPNSADPSSRPETDFCELVWENGHVTSKARKGPPSINDIRSMIHKSQGGRDANGLKMSNFSTINSLFGDFPSVVSSSEMGMGQDADMVPWLSYPDPLNNDYPCDFLPELSGVTMNDITNDHHLAFREKKSGFHGDGQHNSEGLKDRGLSKVDSNTVRYSRGENSEVPGFAPSSQNNVPRSGVSDITRDNVASRDFNSPSLCALTSLRSQKQDAGQPSTSSSFTNFPYFSRPGVLAKTNYLTVNASKRVESGEQRCILSDSNPVDSTMVNLASACSRKEIGTHNPSVKAPVNENPESLPKKPTDEMHSAKRIGKEDAVVNDTQQNHALDTTMSKVGVNGERNMVPVVAASSVCSGNSVDRASNERDLKRKLRETTESEGPSEEVDDESVGAKKAAHAQASSKRIRAAEVHNLSERRRRDRINEKMRSLQELIPNCNKVDKASMLDEAIEYLKTLQLQVQMYSMGAGLYMQPMMLPPGMQPIHGAQMPHFPPMGLGMSMGMGFGMNMPFQSPHYSVPGGGTSFHGMPSSSLQPYAHPGQGLQMSMQRSPVHPVLGAPPLNIPMGVNVLGVAKDSSPEMIPGIIPSMSVNQATNQATKEGIQPPASSL